MQGTNLYLLSGMHQHKPVIVLIGIRCLGSTSAELAEETSLIYIAVLSFYHRCSVLALLLRLSDYFVFIIIFCSSENGECFRCKPL